MEFKKAQKTQAKLKIAICGPSGSGKTYSALRIATGISSKIAVIDTENNSASLYSDSFDFDILELNPPYTVEKYISAIDMAIKAKYEVVIIDSLSHVWDGEGGIQAYKTQLDKSARGNSFVNWRVPKEMMNRIRGKILTAPFHIISAMRSKQSYAENKDSSTGKSNIKKLGMEPIIEPQFEYEMTLVFDVDMNHTAMASKDRTGLFANERLAQLTEETGAELMAWLNKNRVEVKETPKPTNVPPVAVPEIKESDFSSDPEALPFEGEAPQKAPVEARAINAPSDAQLKRLFAITRSNGWDTEEVKEIMRDKYGKTSSKELNWIEYDQLCKFLEANPKEQQ